jgi:hypothetical protein
MNPKRAPDVCIESLGDVLVDDRSASSTESAGALRRRFGVRDL